MALDSHSTKSPSRMTGTVALGFSARNSAVDDTKSGKARVNFIKLGK